MTLLTGFKVVQIGGGSAAAVCGRLLADVGAQVICIDPGAGTMLLAYLNRGKAVAANATERREALAAAHLIVREGQPKEWSASPYDLTALRRINRVGDRRHDLAVSARQVPRQTIRPPT